MASNLTDSFESLLDADEWESIVAVLAGFLAPTVLANILEGNLPFDVPNEVYGLTVMAGSRYSPAYEHEIMLGGGVYTAETVLDERLDMKDNVTNVGAN